MPIRVEDIVAVEDVGCGDEAFEEVFKSDLFALGEISGRHFADEGSQKASWTARESCMVVASCVDV